MEQIPFIIGTHLELKVCRSTVPGNLVRYYPMGEQFLYLDDV